MDMQKHIPSGFSGRATQRPAKIARPARVAPLAYGGRPSASFANLARCARNPWGIALRLAPSGWTQPRSNSVASIWSETALVDRIQHMIPLRSRIPVSRQEKVRWRCPMAPLGIVEGLRRPEKPGYGTRRAAFRAHRRRCATLVMRRHHGASRAPDHSGPGELAKPSYGYHMLDSIH
jgi:hypothetical protein